MSDAMIYGIAIDLLALFMAVLFILYSELGHYFVNFYHYVKMLVREWRRQ